ncbi:MAG: helix-destabilizing protein [Pseudoxanthomonas spadix]|nr:MAG: helix-destabilizing protein [Pseudoxanthomonas spadix]
MSKIEIVSMEVRKFSGTSKQGKPFTLYQQEAYLHNGHAYPDRFEWSLGANADGSQRDPTYAPGFYVLAPGAIQVNREFGALEISRYDAKLLRLPESEQGQYAAANRKSA